MDKTILLWEVTDCEPIRKFRGHDGQINCVVFNSESSVIFSGSFDGAVKAWDVRSRSRSAVQSLDHAKDSVSSLCIHEHEIVTGSLDGKVRKYDIRTGSLITDDVLASVGSVSFTKDGQCILTNCLNNKIVLLDKESGEVLQEFKGHQNSKFKINSCLMNNDEVVLSGSEDGFVYSWSLTEGKVLDKYSHVQHRVVHSIATHPSKAEFLAAAEGTLYLWEQKIGNSDDDD
jgi:mitogen-activated protein kinase organizer 1